MTSSSTKTITAGQAATLIDGTLFGDADKVIEGVAEIDSAGPLEITYAVNKHYVKRVADSRAGVVIVPAGTPPELTGNRTSIAVANPYWGFARILRFFHRPSPPSWEGVHPSAILANGVVIGTGTSIGPFTVVEENARIGDNCRLGSCCFIGPGTIIGNDSCIYPNVVLREHTIVGSRVIIHAGSIIGSDGYGFVQEGERYEKIPQMGHVEIGDDVEIGSLVTIDRATLGKTVIGSGCKLDNLIQIGHNVELGEHCALVAQVGISGSTVVGHHCRFAGQSATSGHLSVGPHSSVAARGVVTQDLPAGSFVSGFPARPHGEAQRIAVAQGRVPSLLRRVAELERRLGVRSNTSSDMDSR